jgi:predicted AAA+ superfamily ATPase
VRAGNLPLADHEDELVILDEVHHVPGLLQQLRGIIDRGRRHGKADGRFLLLESAAMDLLKRSGESLTGLTRYLYAVILRKAAQSSSPFVHC